MQQTAYASFVHGRQSRRRDSFQRRGSASSFRSIVKEACRKLTAFLFTQVGVCALIVLYNILGAFAFHALEGVHGDDTPERMAEEVLNSSVSSMWRVTDQLNVLEEEKWRTFVQETLHKYQSTLVPLIKYRGYRDVHPLVAWSPPASLMYSLSVYTTIGYGNLTPRTPAGKVVTIVYAMVGMPLMLLYMANVGEVLAHIFKFIYFRACRCDIGSLGYYRTPSGHLMQVTEDINYSRFSSVRTNASKSKDQEESAIMQINPPNKTEMNAGLFVTDNSSSTMTTLAAGVASSGLLVGSVAGGDSVKSRVLRVPSTTSEVTEVRKTIPITWALLVLGTYVISGGVVFAHWEGWTVLDGCYFCYISLSTIGFGDLVPGRIVSSDAFLQTVQSKQIMCTVYLLVGMALVAMCFNLMQEEAIENLKTFWRSLGCLRNLQRGRDKLRGKRRKSAITKDEMNRLRTIYGMDYHCETQDKPPYQRQIVRENSIKTEEERPNINNSKLKKKSKLGQYENGDGKEYYPNN